MTRPRKMAMEGIASVLSTEMAAEGELHKIMLELPERERAIYQEAVWGMIRNISGRAERLQNVALITGPTAREAMRAAREVAKAKAKEAKPDPESDEA